MPARNEPVYIQIMGDGFLDMFAARDISATGVSIVVPHRFEDCNLDDEVELIITLPGQRPFMARGQIVHRTKTNEAFFGVQFSGLRSRYRDLISAYVRSRYR